MGGLRGVHFLQVFQKVAWLKPLSCGTAIVKFKKIFCAVKAQKHITSVTWNVMSRI